MTTTVPRTPPSRTSVLLPRPMASSGSPAGSCATKRARSSRSAGRNSVSAAPPARQLVCFASGASCASFPRRSVKLARLVHHHAVTNCCGVAADRTRAHRQHDVAVAGDALERCRQVGDVLDEYRLDPARDAHRAGQRAAIGGDDRRLAGRIDLGQHHRVGRATARARNPRTGRACGCSDAAGRRAPAGGRESLRARPPAWLPSRPDGGHSRRSACTRRRRRGARRRSAGSGGRRP